MAFAVTARHSGNTDQSTSQTLTTDSATPSASALLLVGSCAQNDAHTTTQAPQDPTGGSLTYTQVALTAQVPWESETQFGMRGVVYRAEPGASPSSFAVTVDHYSGTQVAAYSAVALDVTGYDDAAPITQSATNAETVDPSSGDASGTVTLPATPATGALVVAFFFAGEGSGAAGFAAPTIGGQSMTEAHNQAASWTQGGVWSREIDGTESDAVVTCSDLGSDVGQYTAIAVEIPAASGGATVNGTADLSLGALTLSATGRRTVHGSADITLGALTLTGAGSRVVHGTASAALGGLSLTATGRRTVYGSASVPLGGLTLTGTGRRTVHGSASVPLGGIDVTLSGRRVVYGTADASLGGLTLTALGEVVGVTAGTADVTLGGLSLSATGRRVVHGAADLQLGGLNLTGAGQDITHGTAQLDLGALTVTATGHRVVHGTASITFGGLSLSATAAGLAVDPIVLPPFRESAVPDFQENAVPAYRERAVPAYRETP